MNAELVDLLVRVMADAPRLPGAHCSGKSDLFDSPDDDQDAAVTLCTACPALTPCTDWYASLRPEQRPATVTAGQRPRKSPTRKRRTPGNGRPATTPAACSSPQEHAISKPIAPQHQ